MFRKPHTPIESLYHEMGFIDAVEMADKARAVSNLIAELTRQQLSIIKAASYLGLSNKELREILKGQFHKTSLETLTTYINIIKSIPHSSTKENRV